MKNASIALVFFVSFALVIAIGVFVSAGCSTAPTAIPCPSRVTAQADTNFVNRSMKELKGLNLEMLENATVEFKLNNQATVTGTIKVAVGPATVEPSVAFNAVFSVIGGRLNAAVSNVQLLSGPASIPIPDAVKGTLPDSLSRDLTRAFAQVVSVVAPKDTTAQLAAVRTDAAQMVLDFVIPCPNTPAPAPTR